MGFLQKVWDKKSPGFPGNCTRNSQKMKEMSKNEKFSRMKDKNFFCLKIAYHY